MENEIKTVENNEEINIPEHHIQLELCTTRPRYRQGRKLTAVKAYTINNESQHLLLYNVPSLNLREELKTLCLKYGEISLLELNNSYKLEEFTECYHVTYKRIQSARIAKRFLDNKSFYGGILHVCYAPEFETKKQIKQKLEQRLKDVAFRTQPGPSQLEFANYEKPEVEHSRKRPYEECNNSKNIIGPLVPTHETIEEDYKSIGKRKKLIDLPKMEKSESSVSISRPPVITSEKRIVFHKKQT